MNKDMNRDFSKEDIHMAINMLKDVQRHKPSGKRRWKPQWDGASHPLGWLGSSCPTVTRVGRTEKLETSRVASGNVKWCNRFGKELDSFLKVKQSYQKAQQFHPGVYMYTHKNWKQISTHKLVHIHSSIILTVRRRNNWSYRHFWARRGKCRRLAPVS